MFFSHNSYSNSQNYNNYSYYDLPIKRYESRYSTSSGNFTKLSEKYSLKDASGEESIRTYIGVTLIIIKLRSSEQRVLPCPEILLVSDEIEFLRDDIGLNISEIAYILSVKRPTIYAWLHRDNEPSKSKRKRLDVIYRLCCRWRDNGLGRMRSYLYRAVNADKSLFDLLSEQQLDEKLIADVLYKIEAIMRKEKQERGKREALLSQHGFKPLSQEELNLRLRSMTRTAN